MVTAGEPHWAPWEKLLATRFRLLACPVLQVKQCQDEHGKKPQPKGDTERWHVGGQGWKYHDSPPPNTVAINLLGIAFPLFLFVSLN